MSLFRGAVQRAVGDPGQQLIPSRPTAASTAGQLINTSSALTIPLVFDCVRLRADLVSTMTIETFRQIAGRQKVQIANPPVLVDPAGNDVGINEWLFASQACLDLRGNSYGLIVDRDVLGYPSQIELQNPDVCNVRRIKATGKLEYTIAGKKYDALDVWHERAFVWPGSIKGLSVIQYAARTMGIRIAAEQFGADWFADGAHPSSVLQSDQKIDQADAQLLKDRLMAAIKGTREPMVLGAGVKWQQIQVAANESQFLETMGVGDAQVCRWFGVPPELMGVASGATMTYANIEQRGIDFETYRIGPTLVRREGAFTRKLTPRGNEVKFDTSVLQRTDTKTRYTAHAIGIAAKFLTPDDAREVEDMAPLTAAEKALLDLVPLIVTPLGSPKIAPTPAAAPEDDPGADTEDEPTSGGGKK